MGIGSTFTYGITILSIIFVIFIERKNPQTTIAWVLVMLIFPGIGTIFYLMVGTSGALSYFFRRKLRTSSRFTQDYARLLYEQLQSDFHQLPQMPTHLSRFLDIIRMHLNQSGSLLTTNNQVQLFVNMEEHYEDLLDTLSHAKQHINLEYFIIQNDSIGRRLLEVLCQKAEQGVQVRLLYDEFGAWHTNISFFEPLLQRGGKVHRFYGTRLANIISLNHRDHRKIVVVDGEVAYTGGANIGDEYVGLHPIIKPWRDTAVKLHGGIVSMLQLRFLLDWSMWEPDDLSFDDPATFDFFFPNVPCDGNICAQIVSSGPDTGGEAIRDGYVKMINNARRTLYLQTPYFIPDEPLLQALRIAATSGVDVRVMIPGVPDKSFVYAITLSYVSELLRSGIRVYLHEGFIHSKMMVMDDLCATIGTSNFDIRSFSLNFEVNAFFYDEGFASQCREVFLQDAQHSTELTEEEFSHRGLLVRMFESVCRLLAYLS